MSEDWQGAIKECETVEQFNTLALDLARERRKRNPSDGFARAVAAEAVKRKYTYIGNRETGYYIDVTEEERAVVMAKIDKLDKADGRKRLMRALKPTRVKQVQASWEEWIFKGSAAENLGALLIIDFREGKDNQCVYEFDMVPKELYLRLFTSDAQTTLKQIYTMFRGQSETEARNWRETS